MLLSLNGRRIAYDLTGPEDSPVVCFTHSLAADGGMWAEQMQQLLEYGFRVLRIDMRGHGGSAPVDGDYTMSELAADVAGVLDMLGIKRVHFVGLSIGGMIGQALALEHPDKVISAMWCDTLPASPKGAADIWNQRISTVRQAKSVAPLADATTERWLTDELKTQRPGRWKQIRDTVACTSPEGFLGCCAAIMNFDFSARLNTLRLPVLVVCGSDDAGTPPAENRRIADAIAGSRYEEIAGARHFPNVTHPAVFNHILTGWLDDQRHRG